MIITAFSFVKEIFMTQQENKKTRGILVGICSSTREHEEAMRSLDELERLFDTAGGVAVGKVIQVKPTLDARTIIGSGKTQGRRRRQSLLSGGSLSADSRRTRNR